MKNLLVYVLLFICPLSYGASFTLAGVNMLGCENINNSNMCLTILVEGEIVPGDESKLRDFSSNATDAISGQGINARVGKIHISSTGGNLYEAMEIGRFIRGELMTTQVTQDSVCYSACLISYLGGVIRIPSGSIGIHSFYSNKFVSPDNFEESSNEYNSVAADVEQYLNDMRVPNTVLDEMMKVPSSNLKILEFSELERLGIIGIDPVYARMRD